MVSGRFVKLKGVLDFCKASVLNIDNHLIVAHPTDNQIQIQFDNSTYCTNESTGELCVMVIIIGCVQETFDFGMFQLPTQPVSAQGM